MVDTEITRIFNEISPILEKFAKNYNLLIEKYWHGFPSWRFSFKHPKDGIACVEVIIDNANKIEIYGYWWIDDYDKGIRYGKRYKSGLIQVGQIPSFMEGVFREILNSEFNSWSDIAEGFKEMWHRDYSKEQFIKFNDKYPIPNL